MDTNEALRQAIVTSVRARGGLASLEVIQADVVAAGFNYSRSRLSRYAQLVVEDDTLANAGRGWYADPDMLTGSDVYLTRIPFGAALAGRILIFMLTRRYVTTRQAFAAMKQAGHTTDDALVNAAFHKLKRGGFVTATQRGTFTLTKLTLDAVGLTDVQDKFRPVGLTPEDIRRNVYEILGDGGDWSPKAVERRLKHRYIEPKTGQVSHALRELRMQHLVKKVGHGKYSRHRPADDSAPSPAFAPAAAAAAS